MQGVACTLFALMGLRLILSPSLIFFFFDLFSLAVLSPIGPAFPYDFAIPPRRLTYPSFIPARPPWLVFFLLAIDLFCFHPYILFPFLSPLGSLFAFPGVHQWHGASSVDRLPPLLVLTRQPIVLYGVWPQRPFLPMVTSTTLAYPNDVLTKAVADLFNTCPLHADIQNLGFDAIRDYALLTNSSAMLALFE